MKIEFMPHAMWAVFEPSFKKHFSILGDSNASAVMKKAKLKYRDIISDIPPFGKDDILLVNLFSATMVAAVYLSLEKRPSLAQITKYYDAAMSDNLIMSAFLKSRNYYSKGYQKSLSRQAEQSQHSINPYAWKFRYAAGLSIECFDTFFDQCGICFLFAKLGIAEIIPALCAYDYGMAKWTNTEFSRKYTLAEGGPVCDCHYRKSTQ